MNLTNWRTRGKQKGSNHTPHLFQDGDGAGSETEKHRRLDAAIDKLRARYGRKVIYYGSVQESRDAVPMRISFIHIPDAEVD